MSDWIEWNGGECPVDGGLYVEVSLRNGERCAKYAGRFDWDNWNEGTGSELDIIAYRIVEDK